MAEWHLDLGACRGTGCGYRTTCARWLGHLISTWEGRHGQVYIEPENSGGDCPWWMELQYREEEHLASLAREMLDDDWGI